MLKLTLQDIIDYTLRGEFTLENCLIGLITLMQSAIQNAHDSHQVANTRATARNLRQALRCVNPFLRFSGPEPDLLSDCTKLLRAALCIAETEMQHAREDGRDSAPFVGVAISCQIFLARIIERQTKALAKSQAQTAPAPASVTAAPITSTAPAQPASAPAAQAPAAPSAKAQPSPSAMPAPAPLTQRAKWLADQRRRKERKRNSA